MCRFGCGIRLGACSLPTVTVPPALGTTKSGAGSPKWPIRPVLPCNRRSTSVNWCRPLIASVPWLASWKKCAKPWMSAPFFGLPPVSYGNCFRPTGSVFTALIPIGAASLLPNRWAAIGHALWVTTSPASKTLTSKTPKAVATSVTKAYVSMIFIPSATTSATSAS